MRRRHRGDPEAALRKFVETLLRRLPNLALEPSQPVTWRHNLGLRGLNALHVTFGNR